MIKMIVMDMDGTLLNGNNQILSETREALLRVQRQGIRLVLASGRSYTRLMQYAKELEMDQYGGYLVEINGTAIYDIEQDRREVLSQISIEEAQRLFHYFMRWDVEILGHVDDGMFCYMSDRIHEEKAEYRKLHHLPDDFPWTAGPYDFIFDNRNGYPNHTYIKQPEEINRSINKISVTYHESVMEKVSDVAKKELSGKYWAGLTSARWLEIMPLNVTKATGLKEVGKRCGISLDEMMAFGDSENDIEMLKEVGHSVVMRNGLENVKACADEITDSNEENGIAHVLYKHFDL